ncbi:uncharacterized protein [Dendropsophus ebraccatus]|uniref:uncharacterized protein isoform X2 n=1 Tax=Dendropsophus ebraccatus TaxID=150705 RepID=UPI0038315B82
MRKPQPFTIGTRLSIPKCPDFSTSCSGSAGNNHLSGYLVQDAPPSPPGGAAHSHSPVTCMTDRDHLTPGSLVRSIRKITLSRRAETAAMSPQLLARTSHGNCNNNNSRGLRHVTPGAIDPPHDWSVRECHRTAKSPGPPSDSVSDDIRIAPSTGSHLRAGRDSRAPPDIAQLCREIKQVERWVQCKLQDLTDGGDTGSSALLQKKIQTYEGTVLRLSQMVDQVSRAQPSGATSVCSQFQTLRDQWQMLKKMASNQNCTSSGATTLLEFNKKADELEMWMREKEEIPPLPLLLDQNLDKVQITRKILDLRQEQVHYGCLQEDINSLAQKLEKHGRPESRAASTRRKHLNRMWLRLQNLLHEHHQSLQMALEAASLWHEADTILRALEEKSHSAGVLSKDDDHGDQNLRDIASQIMMLDVTVSQVSKLHPLLSSRALQKHQQVKECWARLQHTLRTEKTREAGDPEQSSVGNQEQGLLGGDVPAGCQIEKTKGRTVPVLNMQQVRSQVIGQRPTEAKRCTGSVTSQPGTNHNTQKGTSVTPEVRQLLRELSSSCQWLQGVEQLVSEPTAMRSPELIRKDLKHITLLERQVKARGSALQGLRRNSKRCRKPKCLTEEMEEKIQEVEERFRTLQDTLQRRVSDLRDTLVLSEFMKVVQMEEERKQKETMTPRGAIRGKSDAPATVRSQTFTPLEELQEAVEILNDAVKERERALADSREAAELESKISALSQIMAAAHAKLQDVRSQLEAAEKEFVSVKREAELRDLQGAISQQQQVEADVSKTIGAEVRRLQERREQLQDLSLAWNLSANRSIEDAVRTWNDLQAAVQENKARLQKTERLREFFLQYLGMISWTEVTRDQILSGSPRGRLSRSQREELERTMEKKLKEFEALSGIGWKLIGEDHMLARMIRERLEEVQGLLSWLLMRWRCQKHKRVMGIKANEDAGNVEDLKIASGSASLEEFECLEDEDVRPRPAPRGPTLRKYRRRALSPISFQPPSCRPLEGTDMEEGGPRKCTKGPLWLEPKNLPAGPVIHEPQEEKAEMVSSYLNMKEEAQGTYQSLTVPRISRNIPISGHDSLLPPSESSTGAPSTITSKIFFKTLRRKEKAERCTIQGIMELYPDRKDNTKEGPRYQTSTWPPKQEKNLPTRETSGELETFVNYVRNPLSRDIDAECGSGSKKSLMSGPNTVPSSCPHLPVGIVLTPQVSKEPHMLDNIQDTLTVIATEDSGDAQHLYSKTKPKPTAEKLEVTEEQLSITGGDTPWSGTKAWLEALTSSSGFCRQNIHGYGKSSASSQECQELEDFIENYEIDRLSPIVLEQLDPDWDTNEETMNSPKSREDASLIRDVSDSRAIATCPVLQDTDEEATNTSPVLQVTEGSTTSCTVLLQTGECRTSSKVLQKTRGFTVSSTLLQEAGGPKTSFTVLQETGVPTIFSTVPQETGGPTISDILLQETQGPTISSSNLLEMGGSTTSSTVLQETRGPTTSSTVLQEKGGPTISFTVLQDIGRPKTLSKVLQDTGGPATSSTVHREKEGPTISSTILQKTEGPTTLFTVLRETKGAIPSSTVLQETEGTTSSSRVLQKTGEALTLSPVFRNTRGAATLSSALTETGGTKEHPDDGQQAVTFPSDCVLHTLEPSHHPHDPYSPIETSLGKRIFSKASSLADVYHPDQELLENDDEELEGIWNNAKKAPLVCPAQTHHMAPKEMVGGRLSPVKHESHRKPNSQVVMGAEPNMLVATFTLPPSATYREKSQSTVPALTPCYPEISKSGSVPSSQIPPPETEESAFKVTRKLDFQLMEGTLERKHILQLGGRKASSRTWGMFYAVLVRRTLCFYHDHKHSTKRSASAPPLHLTGALCTPESDYTKRDNCFRLRLMDGSEYLFRAPTPESLQLWLIRLRHNSGMEDSDLLREAAVVPHLSPRIRSLMPDLCQSVPVRAAEPVVNPPFWKEAENMAAEIPKPNSHLLLPDTDGADSESNLPGRRRSQSFSSVVYQKVTPVSGPQDSCSSFSVTVYIDEPLIPRSRCHSFAAPQGGLFSRHAADLKPRNKSVFRKFFRKKE